MNKIELFDNLLNAPMKTRWAAIDDCAAIMEVDSGALGSVLTCYHSARVRDTDEMILDLASSSYAADAARILDLVGVRSIRLVEESASVLRVLHAFLSAGWRVSADMRYADCALIPALRLSRA